MARHHSRYRVNRALIDASRAPATTVNAGVSDAQIEAIPGWFTHDDIRLFRFFLGEQVRGGHGGDLAELGVYLGASAALIGSFQQREEVFTVVDLFGRTGADPENDAETRRYYRGLTQVAFEANYRALHGGLPVVIRGPSTDIRGRAAGGRHRFVHVDASHEYANVLEDIETAKDLLAPGGIVVFDDFQASHFPGVAAAVWPELSEGLMPLALSSEKLYATWGEPAEWQRSLAAWVGTSGLHSQIHHIAEHDVVRVWSDNGPSRLAPFLPPVLVPLAVRTRRWLGL
jgi:Methyltransferase domain